MLEIRKFVGYGAAAAGIGLAMALSLAQPAQGSGAGVLAPDSSPASGSASESGVFTAPSAQCAAALGAIGSAWKADASEDQSERAAARANPDMAVDPSEDQAEFAAFKALFVAARTECSPTPKPASFETGEPSRPAPSVQCTAAQDALKAEITSIRAAATTEGATEGTAADLTQDRSDMTQLFTLMKAAAQACGFTTRTDTGFSPFGR